VKLDYNNLTGDENAVIARLKQINVAASVSKIIHRESDSKNFITHYKASNILDNLHEKGVVGKRSSDLGNTDHLYYLKSDFEEKIGEI
jgi:hypothetical protein